MEPTNEEEAAARAVIAMKEAGAGIPEAEVKAAREIVARKLAAIVEREDGGDHT